MKSPVVALAIAATAFAGSSAYLWSELRAERVRAAQVEATTRELNARIAELEKARANPAPGGAGFIAGSFGNTSATPKATLPPGPLPPDQVDPEVLESWEKMSQEGPSPAMLKMMRAGSRAEMRRQYGDFARNLGLNKEMTSKLIDLLTDQQLAMFQPVNVTDPAEFKRQLDERQQEHEAAIAELIGADKAAQLKQYQDSLPARMEFEVLAMQLDGHDAPLSSEQRDRLQEIFVEERNRVPAPEYSPDLDGQDFAAAFNEWNDDFEQRFRSAATSVLNAGQLGAYNEIRQAQKEIRGQNVFSTVGIAPGTAIRSSAVTISGGNAFFVSGAAASAPVPEPESPKKDP